MQQLLTQETKKAGAGIFQLVRIESRSWSRRPA